MSRGDDRRHAQLAIDTDRIVNQRPSEAPRGPLNAHDPRGPHYWPCPAKLGRRHDISMKQYGRTERVCWHCLKSKAQLLLERVDEFLDNYVDVTDGDDGSPRPNRAMSLQVDVRAGIEELTAVKLAIETFNAAMRAGSQVEMLDVPRT